jgi:hypothetical protein
MLTETFLREAVQILKQLEQELDDVLWRKSEVVVDLRTTNRVRITEIVADYEFLDRALDQVSRARYQLEMVPGSLATDLGQPTPLFPKAVA